MTDFFSPAFDGYLGASGHSGEPGKVQRKIEVRGRQLREQMTSIIDAISLGVGHRQRRLECGEPGIVGDRLLDEGNQLTQVSALDAHGHELYAKEGCRVGLAAIGADLECLGGQQFGLSRCRRRSSPSQRE